MKSLLSIGQKIAVILVVVCLALLNGQDLTAEAAKKKGKKAAAGPDPAAVAAETLKKDLEPLDTLIQAMQTKIQSRNLLSPEEAGKLVDIKQGLLVIIEQHPQNPTVARTVYQAGMLFSQREEFSNAYEMFSFLAASFPGQAYGIKAKAQLQQLETRFGPEQFLAEAVPLAVVEPTGAPDEGQAGQPADATGKKTGASAPKPAKN